MIPIIELYSSIECPFAYLAIHRLRQVWSPYAGRVQLVWRALSLEYVNKVPNSRPLFEAELKLFQQIDSSLPMRSWARPEWDWPATLWPAFEALACAQAQGSDAAWAMSWGLRYAYFAQSRTIALRHELLAIAEQVSQEAPLDLARFAEDWDSGRYKGAVLAESRRGWHELKVAGSPTFVLPDGRQVSDLAVGEIDFDEATSTLRSYVAYEGDPLDVFRNLLGEAANAPPKKGGV
jgi:predicted DsbA family dithiol-disulfide isomerase